MKKLVIFTVLVALVTMGNVVLTIPEEVRSEIGGGGVVTYEEIRTTSVCVSPLDNSVRLDFELFDADDAARPSFNGFYNVNANTRIASLDIEELGFSTGKTITVGQANSAIAVIDSHVDQVEDSMVTFGLVAGVQQ
jgi:hypothetical protein